MRTTSNISSALAFASVLCPGWCVSQASAIWSPTRTTGFSEYFGSCIIIEIRLPRMVRICASLALSRSISPNCIWLASMRAFFGCRCSSARPTVDLPEPDSPTIASFSRPNWKETPRTAWVTALPLTNLTFKSRTSSSGAALFAARIEDVT